MKLVLPKTVRTSEHLAEVAEHYAGVDEFVFDIETVGKRRGHPKLNRVTWLGLASEGRTDVIPMGHPNGELITPEHSERVPWWDENDLGKRGKPKKKWRSIRRPAVFTPAPEQLWATDVWSALEPAFFGDALKIGHGVKFDILSIAKYYDDTPPEPPYGDTMLLARILNTSKAYGLKDITKAIWNHDYDQEHIAKPDKYGENGIEIHPYSKAARYTHLDVKYTWLIWQGFRQILIDRGDENLIRLEMDVLEALIPPAMKGMRLDMDALKTLGIQLSEEHLDLEKKIFAASGKVWDLNSTPQKQEFIYEIRGHKPFAFTATSCKDHARDDHHSGCTPSTKAEILEAYAPKDPVVADLLEYANVQKLRSTYTGAIDPADGTYVLNKQGLPIMGMVEDAVDGRVYTDLVQYGADTNRFSSRGPNLQNVPARSEDPRAKALRTMFIADVGHLYVVADYAQIEYRVLAYLAQDPTLLAAFASGWDPHAAVMAMILDKPIEDVTKAERDVGKSINFAAIYGAGISKIASMAKVSPTKAKWIKNTYEERFPAVQKFKREVIEEARNRKPPYVKTILGHRRPLPALWSSEDGKRFAAERQAVNTVVQGSAADIIKVAMVKLHRALPEHSELMLQVHDELIVQTPEEHAEEVRDLVQNTMESVSLLGTVALEADANIGASWAEAK